MLLQARKEWVGTGFYFIVNPLRAQVNNSSKIVNRKLFYSRNSQYEKVSLNQEHRSYLLTFLL